MSDKEPEPVKATPHFTTEQKQELAEPIKTLEPPPKRWRGITVAFFFLHVGLCLWSLCTAGELWWIGVSINGPIALIRLTEFVHRYLMVCKAERSYAYLTKWREILDTPTYQNDEKTHTHNFHFIVALIPLSQIAKQEEQDDAGTTSPENPE